MTECQVRQIEDANTAVYLRSRFHDADLKNDQRRFEDLIDWCPSRFPVAESVDQHSFAGLIAIWSRRHDIFFAK